MIECYYKWCEYHEKSELFCSRGECSATELDLVVFRKLRNNEINVQFPKKVNIRLKYGDTIGKNISYFGLEHEGKLFMKINKSMIAGVEGIEKQ